MDKLFEKHGKYEDFGEKIGDNPLKIAETQFQNAKTCFQKATKTQKLLSPAFPLQVLGWKSHKKFACFFTTILFPASAMIKIMEKTQEITQVVVLL